jgi:hypothetical protein
LCFSFLSEITYSSVNHGILHNLKEKKKRRNSRFGRESGRDNHTELLIDEKNKDGKNVSNSAQYYLNLSKGRGKRNLIIEMPNFEPNASSHHSEKDKRVYIYLVFMLRQTLLKMTFL